MRLFSGCKKSHAIAVFMAFHGKLDCPRTTLWQSIFNPSAKTQNQVTLCDIGVLQSESFLVRSQEYKSSVNQDRVGKEGNRNNRVLVVDDEPSIHEDFREMLASETRRASDDLASTIFSEEPSNPSTFSLVHAHSGNEAVNLVRDSLRENEHFAIAFVDIRMPPGHGWRRDDQRDSQLGSAD